MPTFGNVRVWYDEEGWGVLDSESTPGGCWVHYSSLLVAGYKRLTAQLDVTFVFEAGEQDGYRFRAVAVWPTGQSPVRTLPEAGGLSPAYRSSLTLRWDNAETPDDPPVLS